MKSKLTNGTRLTAFVVGLLLTTAVAFFIGNFLGEGSHTGKIGSGGTGTQTLPISVTFPDGELTPTKPVTLTATINNTTSKTVTFKKMSFTITTGAAGCEPAWFEVKPVAINGATEAEAEINWWEELLSGKITGTLNYAPGEKLLVTSNNPRTGLQLKMKDTGSSQAACEGANLTVKANLS